MAYVIFLRTESFVKWLLEPEGNSWRDRAPLILSKIIYYLGRAIGHGDDEWDWLRVLATIKRRKQPTLKLLKRYILTGDLGNPMSYTPAFLEASSEKQVLDVFCPFSGETVIDCGAGIGISTVIASRRGWKNRTCYRHRR